MIEIKSLSFSYGDKKVIDDISFDIEKGLSLAVLRSEEHTSELQ